MSRIMVVEDEAVIAMQLEERLARMGYKVTGSATSGAEAVDMASAYADDKFKKKSKECGTLKSLMGKSFPGTIWRKLYSAIRPMNL